MAVAEADRLLGGTEIASREHRRAELKSVREQLFALRNEMGISTSPDDELLSHGLAIVQRLHSDGHLDEKETETLLRFVVGATLRKRMEEILNQRILEIIAIDPHAKSRMQGSVWTRLRTER